MSLSTQTASHIAKSHKPTHKPRLDKECVCPTAPKTEKQAEEPTGLPTTSGLNPSR